MPGLIKIHAMYLNFLLQGRKSLEVLSLYKEPGLRLTASLIRHNRDRLTTQGRLFEQQLPDLSNLFETESNYSFVTVHLQSPMVITIDEKLNILRECRKMISSKDIIALKFLNGVDNLGYASNSGRKYRPAFRSGTAMTLSWRTWVMCVENCAFFFEYKLIANCAQSTCWDWKMSFSSNKASPFFTSIDYFSGCFRLTAVPVHLSSS